MNKRCVYYCVIDLFVLPALTEVSCRGEGEHFLNSFLSLLWLKLSVFRNQTCNLHIYSEWRTKVQKTFENVLQ